MQLNHILSAATAGLCKETCHVGLIASGDHSKQTALLPAHAHVATYQQLHPLTTTRCSTMSAGCYGCALAPENGNETLKRVHQSAYTTEFILFQPFPSRLLAVESTGWYFHMLALQCHNGR